METPVTETTENTVPVPATTTPKEEPATMFMLPDFPVCLIRAIGLFASEDASRFILQTVHFEWHEGKTILVATDGRCLGAYVVGPCDFKFAPFNLPVTWFKHFPLTYRKLPTLVNIRMDISQNSWCVENPILGIGINGTDHVVSCQFPKWRSVVPDAKVNATPASMWVFDPRFTNKFAQFAKLIGLKAGNNALHIVHHASLGPWSVFLSDKNFYGVMMPVRTTDDPVIPSWAL